MSLDPDRYTASINRQQPASASEMTTSYVRCRESWPPCLMLLKRSCCQLIVTASAERRSRIRRPRIHSGRSMQQLLLR